MGRKSSTHSVAAVMVAFLQHKSWVQAELAREVDLSTEALRGVLRDLEENGFPIVSERSHPHVYWKRTKDFYPGGVVFKSDVVPDLLRQLARMPKSAARDRLLAVAVPQLPAGGKLTATAPVAPRAYTEQEEQFLPLVEDSAARKQPLFMRYSTAGRRGSIGDRHVSVHLVEVGPPARFVATCHRSNQLQRFSVQGIVNARVDGAEPFRSCSEADVAAFRAASLDGYRGSGPPVEYSFFVREPESIWVTNNLLEGMRAESLRDGVRIVVVTSGLPRLASFVVGLGEAARSESPALARAVAALARGALEQCDAALGEAPNRRRPEGASPSTGRSPSDG